MNPIRPALALAAAAVLCLAGCSGTDRTDHEEPGYVPGLGEIMGLNQMRHAKLWFAGQAGNWPLAAYEVDELREGFADAARYHPHHKTVPEPLTSLIPEYVGGPLDDLDTAVKSKDKAAFSAAFDRLTAGCNGCHEEAGFGFNVIKRPTSPPYSNQSFAPPPAGPPAAP